VTTTVLVLLILVLAISIVLLAVQLRRTSEPSLLQQQLIDLRQRMDGLTAEQQRLPTVLAEGSVEQLRSLSDVREHLARLTEVTGRLEEVGQSVVEVQELLRVPQLRGTLGEVWLAELLRQVFPEGFYELQYGFRSGERVDAVIRMGERLVPVDSKFPLEACRRLITATGDAVEAERRALRKTLRERVDEIADRYIRPEEGTYEFALMYVPSERVYYETVLQGESLDDESSVVGYALRRGVIPVSPNTFYAYLATVLHGLKGLEVERRAGQILDELAGLRQELGRLAGSFGIVGRHLNHACKQFEETERRLGSLRERVESLSAPERRSDQVLEATPGTPSAEE